VRARRQDHLGRADAARAAALARRLDGEQQALGPAGRHEAGGFVAAVEEPGDRGDDVGLKAREAREGRGVEGIRREEPRVRLRREREHLGAGVIGEAEGAPRLPVDVRAGQLVELGEDVGGGLPAPGKLHRAQGIAADRRPPREL
jgi:hypothetical protein